MGDDYPHKAELSPAEQVIYQMIYEAAELGVPCPIGLDFEEALGFNSTSMGPKMVKRLEEKGLVVVERYANRWRRVQIVSSSKWTAFDPRQKTFTKHIPRGARRAVATDRKPYKTRGV